MEHYGLLGIVPPVLTIVLAFATKDVVVSLFLGILSGALITGGGNPAMALMNISDLLAGSLADGWNIRIFLFCALYLLKGTFAYFCFPATACFTRKKPAQQITAA